MHSSLLHLTYLEYKYLSYFSTCFAGQGGVPDRHPFQGQALVQWPGTGPSVYMRHPLYMQAAATSNNQPCTAFTCLAVQPGNMSWYVIFIFIIFDNWRTSREHLVPDLFTQRYQRHDNTLNVHCKDLEFRGDRSIVMYIQKTLWVNCLNRSLQNTLVDFLFLIY